MNPAVPAFEPARLSELLRVSGAVLTEGLTDTEFDDIEDRFQIHFGPDHRELLATALPLGQRWPDWRADADADLRHRLNGPIDGVLFDVENNAFWPRSWGQRPGGNEEATAVARDKMRDVPKLVPVYSHRYLPAAPCQARSPIFSVSQTDVIYYGYNLENYLEREFVDTSQPLAGPVSRVPFWSHLAEGREDEI